MKNKKMGEKLISILLIFIMLFSNIYPTHKNAQKKKEYELLELLLFLGADGQILFSLYPCNTNRYQVS